MGRNEGGRLKNDTMAMLQSRNFCYHSLSSCTIKLHNQVCSPFVSGRSHGTLHLTPLCVSIDPPVRWSHFNILAFLRSFYSFTLLLLSKYSCDIKLSSCPPTHNSASRVFGRVFFSHRVNVSQFLFAMSVRWSDGKALRFWHLWAVYASLLLLECLVSLFYHCPCPPHATRVSGLVNICFTIIDTASI